MVLEGAKSYPDLAKLAISEAVADMECYVAIECIIPRQHWGKLIGTKGVNARALSQEFNVHIEFPKRAIKSTDGIETATGSSADNKVSAIQDNADSRDVVPTRCYMLSQPLSL